MRKPSGSIDQTITSNLASSNRLREEITLIEQISSRLFGDVGENHHLCSVNKCFGTVKRTIIDKNMCTINMTFEVPDSKSIDVEALKKQIHDIFNVLIARPNLQKQQVDNTTGKEYDLSVFDCFSGDFGGVRDANEIADDLRNSRVFSRDIYPL